MSTGEQSSRVGAILNEQGAVSRGTHQASTEQTGVQALSFIVRIWRQSEPNECRGWVEHVQTGRRTAFLGLDQLRSVIAEAIDAPLDREGSWSQRLGRCRSLLAGWFSCHQEGEG